MLPTRQQIYRKNFAFISTSIIKTLCFHISISDNESRGFSSHSSICHLDLSGKSGRFAYSGKSWQNNETGSCYAYFTHFQTGSAFRRSSEFTLYPKTSELDKVVNKMHSFLK